MSPILVRPVREQLEHDRVIRLLQAKYKRKFEVAINPGHEQTAPVGPPPAPWYPDLVLHSTERGRRLAGIVEVETAESVNNLEAMSQWAAFAKQRAEFHLYVPASSIDVTRRLCADIGIDVTEIWAYHAVGDQLRFVLVQRAAGAPKPKPAPKTPAKPVKAVAAKPAPSGAKRPAAAKPPVKPAAKNGPAKNGAAKPGAAKNSAPKAAAKKAAPGGRARRRRRSRPPSQPGGASPVPFLRVIRDKRGYETTYLMHWFNEGGRQRSRILYAFRGPSLARVGRVALEPAVMRQIAASFPEVAFDWNAVVAERQVIDRPPRSGAGVRAARTARPRRREEAAPPPVVAAAPPPERPRQIPSTLPSGTDEERMAFLAEWYPLVRERVERRTTDEVRRQALLTSGRAPGPGGVGRGWRVARPLRCGG